MATTSDLRRPFTREVAVLYGALSALEPDEIPGVNPRANFPLVGLLVGALEADAGTVGRGHRGLVPQEGPPPEPLTPRHPTPRR